MEYRSQLHASGALFLGTEPPLPFKGEAEWASEPVGWSDEDVHFLSLLAGFETPTVRLAFQSLTVLIYICLVQMVHKFSPSNRDQERYVAFTLYNNITTSRTFFENLLPHIILGPQIRERVVVLSSQFCFSGGCFVESRSVVSKFDKRDIRKVQSFGILCFFLMK